jgi:hypothetical protein
MEINLKVLTQKVTSILELYHFDESIRYKSICFMTEDILLSEAIKNYFYIELSHYEIWLEPSQSSSPPYGISRIQMEKKILKNLSKGLFIYRPEEWISFWPKIEQAAFWSFISTLHGQRDIVLVTTLNAQSDINYYMEENILVETGISYWLSNKVNK